MTIYWVLWIVLLAATFALGETIAIRTGGMTLSRFVWTISDSFPAFGFLCGFLAGFLACHFWWGGIVSFAPVEKAARLLLGR